MTQTDKTLVMTVPQAGRLLGLSRNAAYEAARNGDIPVIRIGRLLKVPRLAFEKMLDVEMGGTLTPPSSFEK